jgi:hypothetical protein
MKFNRTIAPALALTALFGAEACSTTVGGQVHANTQGVAASASASATKPAAAPAASAPVAAAPAPAASAAVDQQAFVVSVPNTVQSTPVITVCTDSNGTVSVHSSINALSGQTNAASVEVSATSGGKNLVRINGSEVNLTEGKPSALRQPGMDCKVF